MYLATEGGRLALCLYGGGGDHFCEGISTESLNKGYKSRI